MGCALASWEATSRVRVSEQCPLQMGRRSCSQDPGGPSPGLYKEAGAATHLLIHFTGSQLWGRVLCTQQQEEC